VDPFERRVEDALRGLPKPADDASDRARRAALDALPKAGLGGRRRMPLLLAAALTVGVVTGGAVAAIGGALRDGGDGSQGVRREQGGVVSPGVGHVLTPRPGRGFSAVLAGHMWTATRGGVTIERLPVTAGTLSPNALYVAAGVGRSLVVMKPGGERSWSRAIPGPAVALSWRPNPNPTEIAYVARVGKRHELRVMEADGDNDRLVARGVAPVAPSWRPDGLGIAYVEASGRAMVHDMSLSRQVPAPAQACLDGRRVHSLAFAAAGDRGAPLVLLAGRRVVVARPGGPCRQARLPEVPRDLAWISASHAVTVGRLEGRSVGVLRRLRLVNGIQTSEVVEYPETDLLGVTAGPSSRQIAVAARIRLPSGPRVEVWVVDPSRLTGEGSGPGAMALIAEGEVARHALPDAAPVEMTWR
jgi:hypothetical protein